MDRTTGQNHVVNGGKRQFTDGPPGTAVEEGWLNAIQEEIMSVIEGAGIAPSSSDNTQLKQAIFGGAYFAVQLSGTQSLASNVVTKISLGNLGYVDSDSLSGWSITNNEYTVVRDGLYLFNAKAQAKSSISSMGGVGLWLYKNGSPVSYSVIVPDSTTIQETVNLTACIPLIAGNVISLYMRITNGNQVLGGSGGDPRWTDLLGIRIGPA